MTSSEQPNVKHKLIYLLPREHGAFIHGALAVKIRLAYLIGEVASSLGHSHLMPTERERGGRDGWVLDVMVAIDCLRTTEDLQST